MDATRLTPGVTLSGHLLSEELGEGGYARVFRSDGAGGTVAIKVAERPEARAALRAEAEALRALAGPRFVRVLAEHLDADPPFLVLEHCPCGDLRRFLEKQPRKRLEPERAIALFEEICEGVAEAHARGVVHGDLKPENVLLDAEARHDALFSSHPSEVGQAQLGTIVGTAAVIVAGLELLVILPLALWWRGLGRRHLAQLERAASGIYGPKPFA